METFSAWGVPAGWQGIAMTLEEALDTLSPDDRAIVQRVRALKSTSKAAQELNLTAGRVRHRFFRSITKLTAIYPDAHKLIDEIPFTSN